MQCAEIHWSAGTPVTSAPLGFTRMQADGCCVLASLSAGDKDCAVESFTKALELSPNDTRPLRIKEIKGSVGVNASLV
jgi:hypothetical protein